MILSQLPATTQRNLRAFVLFRIFFNCRFYYPIFMILFLDFGLSAEQFALLNAIWAVSITLLEVPSGALADQLGRRTLVIASAVLMVLEMSVILITPVGSGTLVFWLFAVNRVISGAAEAAASGADEALAYDSIPEAKRASVWAQLSSRLMLWQSLVFFVVTITGALVYDAGFVNRAAGWLGWETGFTSEETVKWPIGLNLLTALVTLAVATRFRELPPAKGVTNAPESASCRARVGASFRAIAEAGRWILRTPAPLILIVMGVVYDGFIRLYYSVGSQYYRLIDIPDRYLGFLGAAASLLGMGAAWVVSGLYARTRPSQQFALVALLIAVGLTGLMFPVPFYGAWVMIPLGMAMRFLHYFLSNHLNAVTESSHRATVLSFKGLSLNLNYGLMILLFGWQVALIRGRLPQDELNAAGHEKAVFAEALTWWLPFFVVAFVTVRWWSHRRGRGSLEGCLERERCEGG